MTWAAATPRDDVTALPPGEHEWLISIAGDAPLFPRGYPKVVATTAYYAREKAEMLPVIRVAELTREQLVLTRVEGRR